MPGIVGRRWAHVVACALLLGVIPIAPAQEPDESAPQDPPPAAERSTVDSPALDSPDTAEPIAATTGPTDAPDDAVSATAVVIEVAGSVDWAAAGVSPLVAEGWTRVAVGDRLAAGMLIRTGLRSHVNLQFGVTTTVSIRSATYASIDQFYKSATTETVRVGLGYGTVRGGSSEGEMRADVTVDSTVATLAKRGTEGWQIQVEPGTGRFRISLAEYGLVEAIQKLSAERSASRTVRPGEYATHANIANMWIEQDIFDRNVSFYEATGLTEADAKFSADNTRGFGELGPGAGATLVDLSGRAGAAALAPPGPAPPAVGPLGPVTRPEGNFGTPDSLKTGASQSRGRPRADRVSP